MSKKRVRSEQASSVFSAVQQLDSQDERVNHKRRTASKTDVAKSKAARSQTKVNGHLMECRILLQRTMAGSASAETEHTDNPKAIEACNTLLVQLLEARKNLLSGDNRIVSDDDSEDDSSDYYKALVKSSKEDDLKEILQTEYKHCRKQWKEVLNRRHKDLKLHAGLTAKAQFRVMDSSFWEQVDSTVSHQELQQHVGSAKTDDFDDSKVYQHMLQDFLAAAASGVGAEEAAAQRLRRATKQSKKKGTVDRRASKGRKMRYAVRPKLVNFTFPVARSQSSSTTTGMDEDEWFRSLFGGAANRNDNKK